MTEAADGSGEIATNISGVAAAADATTQALGQTRTAVDELSRMAADLRTAVPGSPTERAPGTRGLWPGPIGSRPQAVFCQANVPEGTKNNKNKSGLVLAIAFCGYWRHPFLVRPCGRSFLSARATDRGRSPPTSAVSREPPRRPTMRWDLDPGRRSKSWPGWPPNSPVRGVPVQLLRAITQ